MKLGRRARFVGRGRERALWLLGAAVLIAVLWAVAQPLKWPLWAQVVLAGLAAAAALIIPELRARSDWKIVGERLVEHGLAISGRHGRLPQVRDVSLDQLRVHAAKVQVPYIARDQQEKLEAEIGPGRAVLLVGHSMAGKTRLAAEVVKRKFPDALLVMPESGKALRELFDGGLNPAGVVVWLDDLERFLGVDELTMGLLNRLIACSAIVVATIRLEQREAYRPRDELRPLEWEVLQRFSEVSLQRRLTEHELDRVLALVNDPSVLAGVVHYGLAEYLGAGPEALDKFEKGEIANPVGYALVRAAVDWRRTGLIRPVSEQFLVQTLPTYLANRAYVSRSNEAIENGFVWATQKINETVSLLGKVFTKSNEPIFQAFDYLVDQVTPTSAPVPDSMWSLALKQAEPAELNGVGFAAVQAGKLAMAEAAWQRAIEEGGSPAVAFNLGRLLYQRGDVARAKAAYQRAIDGGHPNVTPHAAVNLGFLLAKQGDVAGAKAAYQRAIDGGDAAVVPRAATNLGHLLANQGDVAGAKAAYQRAIDGGDAAVVSEAAVNLGILLKGQGNLEEAKAAYQQAIDGGDADAVSRAVFNLGILLQEQRDMEGAKAAYQRAIDSGHADVAPMAAVNLGILLQEQRDMEGAKAAYQQAIDSGHADATPKAAVNLGFLLEEQGDVAGAKAAYQQAIESGHTDWAGLATYNLGVLLKEQGDLAGAKVAWWQAMAGGNAEWAPLAANNMGLLLQEQGDVAGAKAAYQQAITTGHPEAAPKAAFNLGWLLEEQGDMAGAKAAYQQAIDSGYADLAPEATRALEQLLERDPPPAS
jgi:tetratricopeptide (TPR) repeat protein